MAPSASAQPLIAPSAIIDSTAKIGKGTRVWAFVQVGEWAFIGENCVLGNGAYVDRHVRIGSNVRIHNKALLYQGVIVEDDVFIGPGVCCTNDPWPRSGLTRNMTHVGWRIKKGAAVGANATILPDLDIGAYAVVGAGSVVTKTVSNFALVAGNPARQRGWVCPCGEVIRFEYSKPVPLPENCQVCGKTFSTDR